MASKIESLEAAWTAWRKPMTFSPCIVGLDPGWSGAIAIRYKGKTTTLETWSTSSWNVMAKITFTSLAHNIRPEVPVFAAIEGTHHYGRASKDDIAGLNRRIGMFIQEVKRYRYSWICCVPPIAKLPCKQASAMFWDGSDINQHQADALVIAQKMEAMMQAPIPPKDPIKKRKSK
jgi:hypothetical protein